jgi:hypothetical protein
LENAVTTAKEVAEWMVSELEKKPRLYQDQAVRGIRREFGEKFSYRNKNGNWAIDKAVLREFDKLSGDDVVWERGDRCWRKRREKDRPGRQQG